MSERSATRSCHTRWQALSGDGGQRWARSSNPVARRMHAALVEKATTNLSAWMEHVPGEAAAATHAEEIGARLRRSDGVVLRVWECSATLSGLRTPEQFTRCVLDELRSTQLRAASLLRWDVPFALYGGGRMRQASPSVVAAHPRSAGELCGCSGRRASTMLGWVLRRAGRADIRTSHTGWARVRAARATNRQGSAFAHDAALWTEAGATMGPPCISGRNSTAEEYARARLDVVERDSPMASLHSACHRHRLECDAGGRACVRRCCRGEPFRAGGARLWLRREKPV